MVDALDVDDVHDLAASLGLHLDESAARRLWRHTEGSTALIVEVLSLGDPRHWAPLDARMPAAPSARRAVARALERCDADARAVVEACAILGRWAGLADLGAVAGVDDLLGAVDRAEQVGLLTFRPGLRPLVGFPSRMARAAAYECMGVLRRRDLHARAAECLPAPGEALQHLAMAAVEPDADLSRSLVAHAQDCACRGSWREAGLAWLGAHRLATEQSFAEDCLIKSVDALVSAGDIVDAASLSRELDTIRISAARLGVQG